MGEYIHTDLGYRSNAFSFLFTELWKTYCVPVSC